MCHCSRTMARSGPGDTTDMDGHSVCGLSVHAADTVLDSEHSFSLARMLCELCVVSVWWMNAM